MPDLVRPEAHATTATAPHASIAWIALGALLAGAGVIYGPILRLGLLSDDFALVAWARTGEFLPRSWEDVRPVPIVMWAGLAAIVPAGDLAFALHGLNVLFHAVNACLVFLLAHRFNCSTGAAALAAALFLVYPTAVEPVVWPTAIFDLTMAMGLLGLGLIVTKDPELPKRRFAAGLAIGAIMLGTKETGVATAPLVALIGAARWGRRARNAYRLAAGIAVLTALYFAWRFAAGRLTSPPAQLGPGVVKTLLFDPFLTLLFPFHENVRRAQPALVWLVPLMVLSAIVLRLVRPPDARHVRPLLAFAVAWVILSTSPLLGMFVVGPDLQGARYVYVPACIWTIGLAAAFADGHERSATQRVLWTVAGLLLTGMAVASVQHLRPWWEAARARDAVIVALERLPPTCSAVYLEQVPDNVQGAPVFRNGLIQALAEAGRTIEVARGRDDVPASCRVSFFELEKARGTQPIR